MEMTCWKKTKIKHYQKTKSQTRTNAKTSKKNRKGTIVRIEQTYQKNTIIWFLICVILHTETNKDRSNLFTVVRNENIWSPEENTARN